MVLHVWGYLDEYEDERDDLLDAVDSVFRSGRLILGESVDRRPPRLHHRQPGPATPPQRQLTSPVWPERSGQVSGDGLRPSAP